MPFNRPTPQVIRDRLAAEIEAALPGADARTRRSVEGVLVRAMSVGSYALHEHLDFISRQILPDTAEVEYLARHASLWGIERRASTPAGGSVQFTGTDGAVIPAGTYLRRNDDFRYETVDDATIADGVAVVEIVATEAGAAGDTPVASKITLISPIAGVQSQGAVIDDGAGNGLTSGADTETDEDLRARVLARIQQPPMGGAEHDYHAWTLEVGGVAKVWVYPGWMGPGTVGVGFITDDAEDVFPSGAEVAAVQAHLDLVRPVTAEVTAFAPTPWPVDLTILLSPDTVAIRAAVVAEIEDFFLREGEPGQPIYLSRLRAAISVAAGEDHHELLIPEENLMTPSGNLPVLGTITWYEAP